MRFGAFRSLGAIAATTAALAASLALAPVAFGETYATNVDLGKGSTVLAPMTVNQKATAESGLAAVIKVRQDALNDANVKIGEKTDDGKIVGDKTVAEYLQEKGISQQDYLSPKRSEALENIAVQRAAEMSAAKEMSHTRPNGDDWSTAKYEGASASSESIAWGVGDIESAIKLWSSEKQAFIEGKSFPEIGHYQMLINPKYTAYGFSGDGAYWAGEAGEADASTMFVDVAGDVEVAVNLPSADVKSGAVLDTTSVGVGEKTQLKASYDGMQIVAAGWKSADDGVFTVDEKGVATGVSVGRAGLTLYTSDETEVPFMLVSGAKEMYRLYNPFTGEHFYTSSAEERDFNVSLGWNDEGLGWIAPDEGTPVFRLYNPYAPGGDHHYTMSEVERDSLVKAGWNDEGVGWYSAGENGAPLYRQYNPYAQVGTHNYTMSEFENDDLVKQGWSAEGIGWYGLTLE